ncbi:hypothetical protein [Amycolatopsis sp. cmx-4-68]|uniref:terminase small subunit n=1 Tax=Amycolatopsis sp. cmx-4-68 TaxID=2790938 RepID=UPI00397C7C73
MSMMDSVATALAQLPAEQRDSAARELAELYALQIDCDPDALETYGPKLLAVLDALGLTPKARAVATKGGGADEPAAGKRNPADELRARRAARLAGAKAVDTATS